MNDHYQCASGGVIAAGLHRLPTWLRSAPVGQWAAVSGSALGSSLSLYDWGGSIPGEQSGVVEGWGGWAVDYVNKKLYVQGGGHSDYGGNEIHCLDLVTMVWSRIVDPSPWGTMTRYVNTVDHSIWNADGSPVASHVYWNAHLIGNTIYRMPYFCDWGQTISGHFSFAPSNESRLHGFVLGSGWVSPTSLPLLPTQNANARSPVCADDRYYYLVTLNDSLGYNALHKYDTLTNTFSVIGPDLGSAAVFASGTYPGSIHDTLRGEIVMVGEKTDTFVRRFKLSDGTMAQNSRTGVSFASTWDSSYTGCCYDSKRDKYYLYSGQSTTDKNVYVCDPAGGYAMSIMSGTGTPPTTTGSGLNSRFKYIPGWDCILMQPTFADPVQVLRLS